MVKLAFWCALDVLVVYKLKRHKVYISKVRLFDQR